MTKLANLNNVTGEVGGAARVIMVPAVTLEDVAQWS